MKGDEGGRREAGTGQGSLGGLKGPQGVKR